MSAPELMPDHPFAMTLFGGPLDGKVTAVIPGHCVFVPASGGRYVFTGANGDKRMDWTTAPEGSDRG